MGYLTLRDIHVETGGHSPLEISQALCKRFDPVEIGVRLYISPMKSPGGTLDFDGIAARSWYSEREDMCAFSALYPLAVFTVHGVGEEPEDVWQNRYRAGRIACRRKTCRWGGWQVHTSRIIKGCPM